MSAPFTGPSPFPDPAQALAGAPVPEGVEQAQGAPEQGAPEQAEQEPIDLEGALAHAIEAACEVATGALATDAEGFQRIAAGVESLANALSAVQPKPNPTDPALVQAIQRQTQADQQHQRESAKIAVDASRPAPSQSSERG